MCALLLVIYLFQYVTCLITPMQGTNGTPDINSIITHMTLVEQTLAEFQHLKTQFPVLESRLVSADNQIQSLSSQLGTCTTDIAVLRNELQHVKSSNSNDCCDANRDNMKNMTLTEHTLQTKVKNLENALADVYTISASNTKTLDSIHLHGINDLVTMDGLVLAFRVQANIGVSVYDTWMNDGIYHDLPVLPWLVGPECQSLNTSQPCRVHYKSKIVSLWDTVHVQYVKVLVIKDSQVRQEIVFDGVGTTKNSWFSQEKVINSTWTDLKTQTTNFFSIEGDGNLQRRFFISHFYHSCPEDTNWLTVVDGAKTTSCDREKGGDFPKILYSKLHTEAVVGNNLHDFEYGDVLAVLVKLA